jgi:hypothetical protein
MAFKNVS